MKYEVVTLRVPGSLKEEFYRALGEAQARLGKRVKVRDAGTIAIALAILYLREQLPDKCLEKVAESFPTLKPIEIVEGP